MEHKFDKKIFSAGMFFQDLGFLIKNTAAIIKIFRDKRITKVFIEKIMSVTTAVNGCVLCSWYHAKQAIDSGLAPEEVKKIMKLQFHEDASEFELPALLYAQHFAETNRKPDSSMTKKLYSFYGDHTANKIILIIRIIYFGNLFGNTWEAVTSRLKGNPAPNSSVIFEGLFFLLSFIIMIPATLIMRCDTQRTKNID